MLSLCHLTPMLAWLVMLLPVFFSKPCFSSSAYSLIPRPFQHVQEGQGTRLEGICDFLYHCPGSPQGWGRNCETNALSIPAVVPRRGGWGISLIGALFYLLNFLSTYSFVFLTVFVVNYFTFVCSCYYTLHKVHVKTVKLCTRLFYPEIVPASCRAGVRYLEQ